MATAASFERWIGELHCRSLPAALVAQNGLTPAEVPWDRIAALFIGGCCDCPECGARFSGGVKCPECGARGVEWKDGPEAAELAREAKRRGKWVHWGRVNGRKRFEHVVSTGAADSFDGSSFSRWRKVHLNKGLGWTTEAAAMTEAAARVRTSGLAADQIDHTTSPLSAGSIRSQLRTWRRVTLGPVELGLALIIIGLVVALLVHYALGIILIVIGLVVWLVPLFAARRRV